MDAKRQKYPGEKTLPNFLSSSLHSELNRIEGRAGGTVLVMPPRLIVLRAMCFVHSQLARHRFSQEVKQKGYPPW